MQAPAQEMVLAHGRPRAATRRRRPSKRFGGLSECRDGDLKSRHRAVGLPHQFAVDMPRLLREPLIVAGRVHVHHNINARTYTSSAETHDASLPQHDLGRSTVASAKASRLQGRCRVGGPPVTLGQQDMKVSTPVDRRVFVCVYTQYRVCDVHSAAISSLRLGTAALLLVTVTGIDDCVDTSHLPLFSWG